MRFHSAVLGVAVLAFGVTGCRASADEDLASSEGAVSVPSERVWVVAGAHVRPGRSLEVAYKPYAYSNTNGYLAVELTREGSSEPTVHVEGDFPGFPELLVTDKDFRILARASGETNGTATDKTSAKLPEDARFALVRDELWVRPMSFNVSVAR